MLVQIPGTIAHVESSEVISVNMCNFDRTNFSVRLRGVDCDIISEADRSCGDLLRRKTVANGRIFRFIKAVNEANANG